MKRGEERLQRELVRYLRAALPKPWLVFHVPNGAGRSKAEAGILKAMGVLAGVPDLLVVGPQPRPGYEGLELSIYASAAEVNAPRLIAIELKAPPKMTKTGKPSKAKPRVSDAQRDVIEALGACGVPTLIVDNMDEALRALAQLGVPLKGRLM